MQSSSLELQSLVARVDRLEKQNRLFKRIALVLLLLPAYLVVTGQSRPSSRTVEAQSFVLRDSSGKERAELSMFNDNPHLTFFDSRGKHRLNLFLLNSGPALTFDDENGEERMGLGTEDFIFRQAGNFLKGENGKEVLTLSATPGTPDLRMYDSKGEDQVAIGIVPKIGPHLTLLDSASKANFIVYLEPLMGAKLGFASASGKSSVDFTTVGGAGLRLVDEAGYSAVLGTSDVVMKQTGEKRTTSAASLKLFDKDGKVVWSAP